MLFKFIEYFFKSTIKFKRLFIFNILNISIVILSMVIYYYEFKELEYYCSMTILDNDEI